MGSSQLLFSDTCIGMIADLNWLVLHWNNIDFRLLNINDTGRISKLENETGVISIDPKGKILSCNKIFLTLFGYKNAKRLIGENVKMLMPEPYRSFHDMYLDRYNRTKIPRIIGNERGRVDQINKAMMFVSMFSRW